MTAGQELTVLEPRAMESFVETDFVRDISERAFAYIRAGFPVHLRGGAGTGKTTIALHLASIIGRPVIMIHGDEEYKTSDLIGGEHGYRISKVRDNFIHSVVKTEQDINKKWVDSRLTIACEKGYTLIYDEFTRSRPEANNVLLPILEEKIMPMPAARNGRGGGYLSVHPDFTAIFTSNPEEYAGVYKSQDALRDRMITLDLSSFDRETEIGITIAKSGITRNRAELIVDIVRDLREWGEYDFSPTVRGCIMIARALAVRNGSSKATKEESFVQICLDVLASETSRIGAGNRQKKVCGKIRELVRGRFGR